MSRAMALAAAAVLMAAAFFLPAKLSVWNDRRLLGEPHITRQEEEREGFAESLQLSIAEKLMLLRSRTVMSVALTDDWEDMWVDEAAISAVNGLDAKLVIAETEEAAAEAEEAAKKWEERLARVRSELRGLQTAGALPYLWGTGDPVECGGHSQVLYIDQESQVSFLVYKMYLSCAPYSMHVMSDAKSGRILAFRLSWSKGAAPDWGFRGAANFGTAWRDYWGMDSVSSAWNSEYIRSVLEIPVEEFSRGGSYNSNADIAFDYNGQALRVPLVNWVYSNTDGILEWNLM